MPQLIPKSSFEVRPRVAVEIRPEGVYGARTTSAEGTIAQAARAELAPGAIVPSLRGGNVVDRPAVVSALRQVLGTLAVGKLRDVTVIVPDLSVRVLLLDFDSLPSSVDDALPVIRFRLAKLLPFPADAAQVSYQVMTTRGRQLQVLAVAIPYEVLLEYELAVREAGYEPGAVLPSTLAVAAAIDDGAQTAALFVNGSASSLTTAILRRGEVLLHRTLELRTPSGPVMTQTLLPGVAVIPAGSGAFAADVEDGLDEGPVVEEFVRVEESGEDSEERMSLEVLQAISVAAAYYEDSMAVPAEAILTAGTLSADALGELIAGSGLRTREVLLQDDVLGTATTPVPQGLLAGLRGALRS